MFGKTKIYKNFLPSRLGAFCQYKSGRLGPDVIISLISTIFSKNFSTTSLEKKPVWFVLRFEAFSCTNPTCSNCNISDEKKPIFPNY